MNDLFCFMQWILVKLNVLVFKKKKQKKKNKQKNMLRCQGHHILSAAGIYKA